MGPLSIPYIPLELKPYPHCPTLSCSGLHPTNNCRIGASRNKLNILNTHKFNWVFIADYLYGYQLVVRSLCSNYSGYWVNWSCLDLLGK
jgi:hypothetical protein